MVQRVACLIAPALVACGGSTRGELGRAEFAYDKGVFGCMSRCTATDPLAARSSAGLWVTNAGELPAFTVDSTQPEVLTVNRSGSATVNGEAWAGLSVKGLTAGEAKVQLLDEGDQSEIDRLPLRVRDVSRIEPKDPGTYRSRLTVMVGGAVDVRLTLRDGEGALLRGIGAVDYSFSGAVGPLPVSLEAAISKVLTAIFAGTVQEYVTVTAKTVGAGTLSATSPAGASLEVPMEIVDASAVTRIQVTSGEGTPILDDAYSVNAEAFAGDERVWSPKCAWSLDPADGPVKMSPGRSTATLEASSPATVTATCAIGSSAGSMTLSFR